MSTSVLSFPRHASASLPWSSTIGYVHSQERFFTHLTVREHLMFHAINRNRKSREECADMVEEVLEELGLTYACDTMIGQEAASLYFTQGKW